MPTRISSGCVEESVAVAVLVVEEVPMTAPTPSPEEFAKEVAGAFGVYWLDTPGEWEDALRPVLPLIAARDAALLAPLRAEVERLQAALIEGVWKLVEETNAKIPARFRTLESPDQIGDGFRCAEREVAKLTQEVERLTKERDEDRDALHVYIAEECNGDADCPGLSDDPDEWCRACRAAWAMNEAGKWQSRAERAEAENARLRAALQPFADAREQFERTPPEKRIFVGHYTKREDWIEARRALAPAAEGGTQG